VMTGSSSATALWVRAILPSYTKRVGAKALAWRWSVAFLSGPMWSLGAKTSDPVEMYLQDVFTVTVNLAGLPGISVPAGLTQNGLPLGLQLIGKAFDEATLLRAAGAVEL